MKKRDESPRHTSFFPPIKTADLDDSISSHILARAPNPKGHLYRHASSLPFPAQIGYIDLGEKSKKKLKLEVSTTAIQTDRKGGKDDERGLQNSNSRREEG